MSSSGATEPAGAGEETNAVATPPGRRPRPVFLLIGIVLAVALGIGLFTGIGTGGSGRSGNGRPQVGDPVPAFSLPRLGGGAPVSVPADGGGDGRGAVLVFFASWCGPCRSEIPAIAAALRRHPAKVAVIGVDGSDPTANALAFVKQSGVAFPVGADQSFSVTETQFDFSGLPEAVLVRPNGTVGAVVYGALSVPTLQKWEREAVTPSGS